MEELTIDALKKEAIDFSKKESIHDEAAIFGSTDGKAIGTYLEHKFKSFLSERYNYQIGNSASGIDFPEINVDIKVTSITQPQSSCPFKSARQKIYGLGYSLLVFVYEKMDNNETETARLNIIHTVYIDKILTADFQLTKSIKSILENDGNKDDLLALFSDKNLPVDNIGANALADEILQNPPETGYLTISNALQWRLQYGRIIKEAGLIPGIDRLV